MAAICILSGNALADAPAHKTGDETGDGRIKFLAYDDTRVYTISARYGYQTNIVFSSHEEVETISVGDRSMWQIIPAGNRIFIRPMEEGMITNMTVLTNKRSYQFDLKSLSEDDKNEIIYVAKFTYPEDKPRPAEPPPSAPVPAPTPTSAPFPPDAFKPYQEPVAPTHTIAPARNTELNYNYTYAGPDEASPLQVYDDGVSTYFTYRENREPLPSLYIVQANGDEQLVPYTLKEERMVVDRVASEWIVKHRLGTVRVYNELLAPSGL